MTETIKETTIAAMNMAKKLLQMESADAFAAICYCIEAVAQHDRDNPAVYAETVRRAIKSRLEAMR